MKKYILFVLLFAVITLSGCKKTTNIVITPENAGDVVTVNSDNGDLADFFDAVPGKYELVSNNDTLQVSINFVVNKEVKEYLRGEFMSFVLVPLSTDNAAIGNIIFEACCGKEMNDELFGSAEGANVAVKFQYIPASDEEKEMVLNELNFCRVELSLADMVIEENFNDEPTYDDCMDMYIQGVIENNEEIIMATAESMAEAQMEGLLTPEQEKRWQNINTEIEQKKAGK